MTFIHISDSPDINDNHEGELSNPPLTQRSRRVTISHSRGKTTDPTNGNTSGKSIRMSTCRPVCNGLSTTTTVLFTNQANIHTRSNGLWNLRTQSNSLNNL